MESTRGYEEENYQRLLRMRANDGLRGIPGLCVLALTTSVLFQHAFSRVDCGGTFYIIHATLVLQHVSGSVHFYALYVFYARTLLQVDLHAFVRDVSFYTVSGAFTNPSLFPRHGKVYKCYQEIYIYLRSVQQIK